MRLNPGVQVDRTVRVWRLVGFTLLCAALGAAGSASIVAGPALGSYTQCAPVLGYVVYANDVTCPTAKSLSRKLLALAYTKPKVTTTLPNYTCVIVYNKLTRKAKAGSCLRVGTTARGFAFSRAGAVIPLPPGAEPGAAEPGAAEPDSPRL
jgi:hypothetical protein